MRIINRITLCCCILIAILSACATPVTMSPQANTEEIKREQEIQRKMALEEYIKMEERLFNVSYPILQKNYELCEKKVKNDIGITIWNIDALDNNFKYTAQNLYNLDSHVTVKNIHKQSPAYKAGIRANDKIVFIDGVAIGQGKNELKKTAQTLNSVKDNKFTIIIQRGGETLSKDITPNKICDYPIVLNYENNELNAYADGNRVVIFKGMMNFANTDEDLALIVGHELAHNAMGHINKKMTNMTIGRIGGLALDALLGSAGVNTGGEISNLGAQIGASSYSIDFEKEADYVGMYFMARAGYDTANVANLWRRMAIANPNSINKSYSHPTNPDRFLAIEKTYLEIKNKQAKRLALVPEMKIAAN